MNIPKINHKVVCISTDKSSSLAKTISSYFIKKGTYFAVFNFLDVSKNQKELVDYDEDNLFQYILGNKNAAYIKNSIMQINPKFVIFSGLNNSQKSYFKDFLEKEKIEELDIATIDDLKKYSLFKKSKKYPLKDKNHDNIVIIEDGKDLSTVIAENLAYAMNADILYIDDTERHLLKRVSKHIYKWKKREKIASYNVIKNLVNIRVGDVNFNDYKTATFFTNGLPYGLILKNPIPFCYVHKHIREDIVIINTILYSKKTLGIAVSFSIQQFINSEPKRLSDIFIKNNIFPIELFSENATSSNLENYVSFFPYDVLHISSHGNIKTVGNHVKLAFKDRKGGGHILEYYEVVTFSAMPLEKEDKISVYIKQIFLKFDGCIWMSKELEDKKIDKFIYDDMIKALRNKKGDENKRRTPISDPIIDSSVISCTNGPHQGNFHCIASQNAPVIFNNSCWSWSEISTFFLGGGVRSYIGTLWSIKNGVAENCALSFYENILNKGKSIPEAVWEINKSISIDDQQDIFFAWTLPFARMEKVPQKDLNKLLLEIDRKINSWIYQTITTKDLEVRENSERIVKFLFWAAYNQFNLDFVAIKKDIIEKKLNHSVEEYSSIMKRDDFIG